VFGEFAEVYECIKWYERENTLAKLSKVFVFEPPVFVEPENAVIPDHEMALAAGVAPHGRI